MIMPHPYENNTWIIHYKGIENGEGKIQKVNFLGPLKEALKHEKTLRAFPKIHLTPETVASILAGEEVNPTKE